MVRKISIESKKKKNSTNVENNLLVVKNMSGNFQFKLRENFAWWNCLIKVGLMKLAPLEIREFFQRARNGKVVVV